MIINGKYILIGMTKAYENETQCLRDLFAPDSDEHINRTESETTSESEKILKRYDEIKLQHAIETSVGVKVDVKITES
jgi:hypothetical protein